MLTEDAIALLCTRLSTPLQLETYLSRAFEEGFNVGQKPVTVEVIGKPYWPRTLTIWSRG